jgi:DNA adenine methylase/adenine-specific DNA-methyltransferase
LGSKRTVRSALDRLRRHARAVERIEIPHRHAFGTHAAAERRAATEYVFVGR